MSFDLFAIASLRWARWWLLYLWHLHCSAITYPLPVFAQRGLVLSPPYVGTIPLPAGAYPGFATIAAVGLAGPSPAHRLVSIGLLLLAGSFA